MSSWTDGEVLQLKKHGNDYARKVWLANAPPIGQGGRPQQGDDINVFKRFVVNAYEHKKYYDENGANSGNTSNQVAPKPSVSEGVGLEQHQNAAPMAKKWSASSAAQARAQARVSRAPTSVTKAPVAAPAPVPPAADLLDFGAFDSSPAPIPAAAPTQAASSVVGGFADFSQAGALSSADNQGTTFDPFNNNAGTASASAGNFADFSSQGAQPVQEKTFDPFNNNNQQGTPNGVSTMSTSDPFASTSNITVASTAISNASFDPFGNSNANSSIGNNNAMQRNSMNGMNGGTPKNIMGNMGMNNGMSAMNGMQNMISGNSMNNSAMMNGNGMMNNNMMTPNNMNNSSMSMGFGAQQQSMMMMQQQSQQHNSFGMNTPRTNAMNVNIMQPMNNSISSNFGTPAGGQGVNKKDPFSSLGF